MGEAMGEVRPVEKPGAEAGSLPAKEKSSKSKAKTGKGSKKDKTAKAQVDGKTLVGERKFKEADCFYSRSIKKLISERGVAKKWPSIVGGDSDSIPVTQALLPESGIRQLEEQNRSDDIDNEADDSISLPRDWQTLQELSNLLRSRSLCRRNLAAYEAGLKDIKLSLDCLKRAVWVEIRREQAEEVFGESGESGGSDADSDINKVLDDDDFFINFVKEAVVAEQITVDEAIAAGRRIDSLSDGSSGNSAFAPPFFSNLRTTLRQIYFAQAKLYFYLEKPELSKATYVLCHTLDPTVTINHSGMKSCMWREDEASNGVYHFVSEQEDVLRGKFGDPEEEGKASAKRVETDAERDAAAIQAKQEEAAKAGQQKPGQPGQSAAVMPTPSTQSASALQAIYSHYLEPWGWGTVDATRSFDIGRYVHPAVEVKNTKSMGRGLFVNQDVVAGEMEKTGFINEFMNKHLKVVNVLLMHKT
jgi:hypothetical protein